MHLLSARLAVPLLLVLTAACSGSDATGTDSGSELELRPDGIGPYVVGQPADEVIDGLSASIGGSDADSDDPDTSLQVPDCGEPGTRVVSWGNLVLFFVDRFGTSVFQTWSYGFDPVTGNATDIRRLGLVTEESIGLGSSRDELSDAYRSRLVIDEDVALDLATFTIDELNQEHLAGRLTSVDPDATLQFLERRPACTGSVG